MKIYSKYDRQNRYDRTSYFRGNLIALLFIIIGALNIVYIDDLVSHVINATIIFLATIILIGRIYKNVTYNYY